MNTKDYKIAMKLLRKITDNLSNNHLVDFVVVDHILCDILRTLWKIEQDKLEACWKKNGLYSIYISEDKNMSNCKRTMVVNLLLKIIDNLYELSNNHLIENNDIERITNLAKTAESIIKN